MVGRLRHLDDAADVGDGLALGDELLGGPLLLFEKASPAEKPFGLQLADDLLCGVSGALHGGIPGPVWPVEDSHSPWTGYRGPRHHQERQARQVADTMPWPDGVRGAAQQGVILLSSSYGLCSDGWLESSNRLALGLDRGMTQLWLGFYIPDVAAIDGQAALELEIGDGQEVLLRGRLSIKSGETRTILSLPEGITQLPTVTVRSFLSYQPADQGDLRQLVSVLSELQAR